MKKNFIVLIVLLGLPIVGIQVIGCSGKSPVAPASYALVVTPTDTPVVSTTVTPTPTATSTPSIILPILTPII